MLLGNSNSNSIIDHLIVTDNGFEVTLTNMAVRIQAVNVWVYGDFPAGNIIGFVGMSKEQQLQFLWLPPQGKGMANTAVGVGIKCRAILGKSKIRTMKI